MENRDEAVHVAEDNVSIDPSPQPEVEVNAEPPLNPEYPGITIPPSKKKKSWLALIVIILLFTAPFAFLVLLDGVGSSGDDDDNTMDITIQDIAEVRDLEALEDITYRYMTEEDLEVAMGDMLDQEALNESARVLYSIFLIDSIDELAPAYTDALTEQVLGYYDSESKEMVIIDTGSSSDFDTIIMVHEFTHALQDQHFDLSNFTGDTWDESSAMEALVEGDASFMMIQYILSLSTSEQLELASSMYGMEGTETPEIPYAIEKLMSFPYLEGMTFAQKLYGQNGWDGIDGAYETAPISTEQILHFDKYQSGEMPVQINIFAPDNISGLGLTLNDTLGEYMVSIMLERYIPASEAAIAAAGWGGDSFFYYENQEDWLSCWIIEWDFYSDVDEFHMAFDNWLDNPDNPYASEFENGSAVIELHDKMTYIYRASDPSFLDGL